MHVSGQPASEQGTGANAQGMSEKMRMPGRGIILPRVGVTDGHTQVVQPHSFPLPQLLRTMWDTAEGKDVFTDKVELLNKKQLYVPQVSG